MASIGPEYLDLLQAKGLIISQPFPDGHAWEHGVRIGKPASIPGNTVSNLRFKCDGITVDAPTLVLYSDGKVWIVELQDKCPDPGPGDFQNIWNTEEDAAEDILDYYFGDPKRMQEFQI